MNPDDVPVADGSSQDFGSLERLIRPGAGEMNVNVVGRRLLAFVVDACFAIVVISVADSAIGLTEGLESLAMTLGFLVYKSVGEGLLGVTLGKRILNVKVVDLSGQPIVWSQAITRNAMLIPGALLLFIPSLAIMESSPAKQWFGDRIAGTIVVGTRNTTVVMRRFDPLTGQPIGPTVLAKGPEGVAQSGLRIGDWWLIVAGSVALAATTVLATTIVTIDLVICSQTYMVNCDGELGSPVWPGSATAHALAVMLAMLAVVAIPAVVGIVDKRWVWVAVSAGVWGVAFMSAVMLGYWITSNYYSSYYSELTDNAGAGIVYVFFLIIGWPIPAFFAFLGILGGLGIDRLRK